MYNGKNSNSGCREGRRGLAGKVLEGTFRVRTKHWILTGFGVTQTDALVQTGQKHA